MSVVELSDDDTVVIFTRRSKSTIESLDATQQRQVLKRLIALVESLTPRRFIEGRVSGCEELEKVRAGDYLRIYCKLVDDIPKYNILYVFEVDPHNYRHSELQHFDEQACEKVREIEARTTPAAIEEYVQEWALNEDELREILDKV